MRSVQWRRFGEMSVRRRRLWQLLFPGALILVVVWAVARADMDQERFAAIVRMAFYALVAVGLLVGWRFRRSRLMLSLVAIAAADHLLCHARTTGLQGHGQLTHALVALLLPLNLLAVAVSRDRGLFTWGTLWRLGLVLAQVPLAAFVCLGRYRESCISLQDVLLPGLLPVWVDLPHIAVLAFAIVFLTLLLRAPARGDRMDAALPWALIAAFLGLASTGPGPPTSLYLGTGTLILVVAVVEESFRMAYHDALTGLPGRRALDEALLRLGRRYAVAMIDVDGFKRINDRHGHAAGDQVLRMVTSRILGIGGRAKAFRYGGDEFAVIFPGKGTREAVPHLQRVRRAVASSPFYVRGKRRAAGRPGRPRGRRGGRRSLRVHLSIGVAEWNERHPNPQDVLMAADQALYRAKRAGRNRVAT